MFERALRTISLLCSAIIVASFALFAVAETRAASDQTAIEVAGQQAAQTPTPTPPQERARERVHAPIREWIDDVDDVLLSPFAPAVSDSNQWAGRGIPAVLGLLLYGFGFGFLARFARGRA